MILKKSMIFFILLLTTAQLLGQIPISSTFFQQKLEENANYYLVFEDNFDGNSLDLTKWNPVIGVPRDFDFSQQKAWHQPDNLEVSNGTLKIIAKKLDKHYEGTWETDWSTNPPKTKTAHFNYTTGELWTKQKFLYGKYEIRCRLPKGKGFWPAFWTYGGKRWNEIDFFEIYGDEINRFTCNVHHDYDGDGNSENCRFAKNNVADFSQWHVFTCIFDYDKITWQIDGKTIRTFYRFCLLNPNSCGLNSDINNDFQEPAFPEESMHIIVNLAIQSGKNAPNRKTIFPKTFEVDYVRFYAKRQTFPFK